MNLAKQLIARIEASSKSVVIAGDAVTDVWVHGLVGECQEGCLKLVEESRVVTPGGAANACECLRAWNLKSTLFARNKNDRPMKYRFVDPSGLIRLRHDDERVLSEAEGYGWLRITALERISTQCDAVLLSDYDKGFLTPEFIRDVVELCKHRSIPCVVDAKRDPELYRGAIVKGNGAYFSKWGVTTRRVDSQAVTTYGPSPPLVWDRAVIGTDASMFRLPSVECVNHVGAGDCFGATLTLALAYGFSLQDATSIAHSSGRVYVQHPHNRPPLPQEVAGDMDLAVKSPTTAHVASRSGDGPGHT